MPVPKLDISLDNALKKDLTFEKISSLCSISAEAASVILTQLVKTIVSNFKSILNFYINLSYRAKMSNQERRLPLILNLKMVNFWCSA
jgi:hypothetical protein